MTNLTYSVPVLLVGAGPLTREDFDFARRFAEIIVAVDGGFDALADWDIRPDAVLGDMDSIRGTVPVSVPLLPIDGQDTTDLEKALCVVDAPLIIGIGFLDGRLDHTLAAMHALVAAEGRRSVLVGSEDVVFAALPEWRASLVPGTRVSFYPVRRVLAVGSKGLRWPIDGLLLDAGLQIGVSNEAAAQEVAAWFADRGAVTILPRAFLGEALDSLT